MFQIISQTIAYISCIVFADRFDPYIFVIAIPFWFNVVLFFQSCNFNNVKGGIAKFRVHLSIKNRILIIFWPAEI